MRYGMLRNLGKTYFTYRDVAKALGINDESAKISCNRYVRGGYLVRFKRNFYMLKERWDNKTEEDAFQIANVLQVPSYISLGTALEYYGLTTQIQRDFIESIAVKRTQEVSVEGFIFKFTKIKKELYRDFVRNQQFFIATPEKALLDALYLSARGRYRLDPGAIAFDKINKKRLGPMLRYYPAKVKKMWERYADIAKA
jgi:predicted transcriptional regulator of viral defense system